MWDPYVYMGLWAPTLRQNYIDNDLSLHISKILLELDGPLFQISYSMTYFTQI